MIIGDGTGHQLGGLRREFRAATRTRLLNAGMTLVAGIVFAGVAIGVARTDQSEWWQVALPGLIGVLGVVVGAGTVIGALRNTGEAVLLYEQGFVHRSRHGEEVFAWQDVDHVWEKVTRYTKGLADSLSMDNTDREYTVERRDGRQILLKEFVDVKVLGPAVAEQIARRWLPWVIGELSAGRSVWLGHVGLTPEGLQYGQAVVPWPQVTLAVHNGVLVVSGRPWLPTHQIPNFRVVPAVVAQLSAQRRPAS